MKTLSWSFSFAIWANGNAICIYIYLCVYVYVYVCMCRWNQLYSALYQIKSVISQLCKAKCVSIMQKTTDRCWCISDWHLVLVCCVAWNNVFTAQYFMNWIKCIQIWNVFILLKKCSKPAAVAPRTALCTGLKKWNSEEKLGRFIGCWGGVYSFQLSVSAPANNPKTTQQTQPSHWVEKQPSTWVKTYEK